MPVTTSDAAFRDPATVLAALDEASALPDAMLRARASRGWWDLLASLEITLFVTREYEHTVVALTAVDGRPRVSFLRLPHPSGLVIDQREATMYIAATRNPNQIFRLRPANAPGNDRPVHMPDSSTFHPGRLYLHDLAMIKGHLHGNAVGMNAVAKLRPGRPADLVWWPKVLDPIGDARFERNYLQLNSIAAGGSISSSYFSASSAAPGSRRPGQLTYPVVKRGVIFGGGSREVVATGLTRPHSARLHEGRLWVDNSGYGEVGIIEAGGFTPLTGLSGWTRGLCFVGSTAFVGTSMVLPRFERYAPGVTRQVCGVHAVDWRTGEVTASLVWPEGNQIFAIDSIPATASYGFPFTSGSEAQRAARSRRTFYSYRFMETDNG